MSFIAELKRRKVLHTAGVYGVSAFGITEILTFVFENFGVPLWANRLVASLFVAGFPIAMFLSWVFDVEPGGRIKRTRFKGQSTTPIVAVAMVLLVVATAGLFYLIFPRAEQVDGIKAAAPDNSIAVLAFADMSPKQDQEYFADGLSDTLIHVLAQVSGLKVTAKTSSFYFKGRSIDVGEIGRKLNVLTILEGSVQKAGNRVRVTAQLVNADDGTHLWSKRFDRDLEDIFVVQDEIAQEVVEALRVSLLDTEQGRLTQRYRPTLEAYEQLILGRQEMAKRTAEALAAAELHFKKAIELDPEYALAYTSLADTYDHQVAYATLLVEESLQRRQPLIEKALELDPFSGEAYAARASLHGDLQQPWEAEKDFLKAIELNPNYAAAHQWYAGLLEGQGRLEEGLAQIRRAAERDPMAPIIQDNLARSVWHAGRDEEARTLIWRNIERNPEFPQHYATMSSFQFYLGNTGEAQRWLEKAHRLNPGHVGYWSNMCVHFLDLGDELSAEDCVNRSSEVHPEIAMNGRAALLYYRKQWFALISILESTLEQQPGNSFFTSFLAEQIARLGDVERARSLMADVFPELLEDEVELSPNNFRYAATFATILHANGEIQQRDVLLLALEEHIATMHRTRARGYGILDVYIHAIRGDRDRAIAGLREAIDAGWRGSPGSRIFALRVNWKLASLQQAPEFIALLKELDAEMEKQRQWYEENKDKPLL